MFGALSKQHPVNPSNPVNRVVLLALRFPVHVNNSHNNNNG